MGRLLLAALTLATLLAGGCDWNQQSSWFPLTEGMTWRYRTELTKRKQTVDSVYRVLGPLTLPQIGREGIAVEEHRSTRPTAWNGPDEVELSVWITDGDWMNRVYLQYDGKELVPQIGFEDRKILPVHLRAGMSWESTTIAIGEAEDGGYAHRHRLERETAPIVVPAGTFRDCLRLETESVVKAPGEGTEPGDQEIVYLYREWYAPKVGLVRMESWGDRERTDERSKTELVEFGTVAATPTERSEAEGKP
ncbi:MAG: hypothetical protein ACREQL_14215 [Candidatus Binatia bacterium]